MAQILPLALSPIVVSTAGTKEVKKRIHSCYENDLVFHEHCTPYFAHVQGNKNCKVDMTLCIADILDVKLPAKERSAPEKEQNEQWKESIEETAKEIQEI